MKVAFALALSPDVLSLQPLLLELERHVISSFERRSYGAGVKEVILLLSAVDERLRLPNTRRPIFHRGLRQISDEGFNYEIDDLLEFEVAVILPKKDSHTLATLGGAAASGVQAVSNDVIALDLVDFNARDFLEDLEASFSSAGQN